MRKLEWGVIFALTLVVIFLCHNKTKDVQHPGFVPEYLKSAEGTVAPKPEVTPEPEPKPKTSKTVLVIGGKQNMLEDPHKMAAYIRHKNRKVTTKQSNLIVSSISNASSIYALPKLVILGLMDVESDYNVNAVSNKGAQSLLQVLPSVWVHDTTNKYNLVLAGIVTEEKDLFDIEKGTLAGTYILKHYYTKALSSAEHSDTPLEYALTRYLGGTRNNHYEKFQAAVSEYLVFSTQYDDKLMKNDALAFIDK